MKRILVPTILLLVLLLPTFSAELDNRNVTFAAYKSSTGSQQIDDGTSNASIKIIPSSSMTQISQTTWTFPDIAQDYTQTLSFFTWELTGISAKVTFSVSGPLMNYYDNTKKTHYTLTLSTTGSTTLEPRNRNGAYFFNGTARNSTQLTSLSLQYSNNGYTASVFWGSTTSSRNSRKQVTYTDQISGGDFTPNSAGSNFTAIIDTSNSETSASITYTLSANPSSVRQFNYGSYYDPATSSVLKEVTRTGKCTIKIDEESFLESLFPGKFGAIITVTLEAI